MLVNLKRRDFLKAIGLGMASAALPGFLQGFPSTGSNGTPPNIVIFLVDDLGWKDVGYHESEIQTPNIDTLAANGTQLNQFYVMPVCSPTRASFLTGRYTIRYGLQVGVIRPWAKYGLSLFEWTLPQRLSEANYFTAITGKWHLGHFQRFYLPTKRGFEHQYGCYNGNINYYTHLREGGIDWHRDDRPLEETGHATSLIRNEAISLINQHDVSRPLFLYVPFTAPHAPIQPLDSYLNLYNNEDMIVSSQVSNTQDNREKRRKFAGMVTHLDDGVGQIMTALQNRGMEDNTLVLFISDNGGNPGKGANNDPLREAKGNVYEGGVRVPAVAYWPGYIPSAALVNEPLHMVDIYPTLLNLAGVSTEQPLPLDGKDAWATIAEGAPSPHEEILVAAAPGTGALRQSKWKFVRNGNVSSGYESPGWEYDQLELFDLESDPNETTDLSAIYPEKFEELKARLMWYTEYEAVEPLISPPKPDGFVGPEYWEPLPENESTGIPGYVAQKYF